MRGHSAHAHGKSFLMALAPSFMPVSALVFSLSFISMKVKVACLSLSLLLVCIYLISSKDRRIFSIYPRQLVLALLLLLVFLKDVFLFFLGEVQLYYLFYTLSNLLVFFVFCLIVNHNNVAFLKKYLVVSVVISVMLLIIYIGTGVSVVVGNIPAFTIIFTFIYFAEFEKFNHLFFFLCAATALIVGIVLTARTAIAMLLIYLLLCAFKVVSGVSKVSMAFLLVLTLIGSSLAVGTFFSQSTNLIEQLSHRPIIWNYYLQEINDAPFFGHGRINLNVANEVGASVNSVIGRGRSYSAHNFYINVLYENGFVLGLLLLIYIFIACVHLRNKYSIFVVLMLIMGVAEPIYIGGFSPYDNVLTLVLAVALGKTESFPAWRSSPAATSF